MGLPIEEPALPFQLRLLEGEGSHARLIPLTGLTANPAANPAPVKITENMPLTLELASAGEAGEPVIVVWDELLSLEEGEEEQPLCLTPEEPEQPLFRANEEYPWRCGLYRFQVRHAGITYYGAYEIVPRNFSEGQLRQVHDTINRYLEGLVADYFAFKSGGDADAGLDEVPQWQYFLWYKKREQQLLTAVRYIETITDLDLKEAYAAEYTPKRQTAKSIRWSATGKGSRYQGVKALNRRMALHPDSPANRLVKYWIGSMLRQMRLAMASLNAVYDGYASEYDRLIDEIEEIQKKKDDLQQIRVVSRADRENMNSTLLIKKAALEKTTRRLKSLQSLEQEYRYCQSTLRRLLLSDFWREVKDAVPAKMVIGRHQAYRQVYELWQESIDWDSGRNDGRRTRVTPAAKPTALLYEYYVLFTAIDAFRQLGFRHETDSLTEQLELSFSADGLQEGASVRLRKGDCLIEITYDQLVESHEQLALERNMNFFSNEAKRKPDVRIDCYIAEGERERFRSTMILEVKYRPFWNIYSELGNTETMVQMSKYDAIKYVTMVNGRKQYNRHPVYQVICCYPGDPRQDILLETGSGMFLQLYPTELGETVGLEQLKDQIRQWLKQFVG
jgi:hypothetical protein